MDSLRCNTHPDHSSSSCTLASLPHRYSYGFVSWGGLHDEPKECLCGRQVVHCQVYTFPLSTKVFKNHSQKRIFSGAKLEPKSTTSHHPTTSQPPAKAKGCFFFHFWVSGPPKNNYQLAGNNLTGNIQYVVHNWVLCDEGKPFIEIRSPSVSQAIVTPALTLTRDHELTKLL